MIIETCAHQCSAYKGQKRTPDLLVVESQAHESHNLNLRIWTQVLCKRVQILWRLFLIVNVTTPALTKTQMSRYICESFFFLMNHLKWENPLLTQIVRWEDPHLISPFAGSVYKGHGRRRLVPSLLVCSHCCYQAYSFPVL